MSDMDKHQEVEYLNKPYFVQLKRVLRAIKKIPDKDKPLKAGAYLQAIRKIEGNATINEKIARDAIGTKMSLTPNEVLAKLRSHEVPLGKKLYVKPETAYQQTQRLIASRAGEDEHDEPEVKELKKQQKQKFEPINRTISVSVFGHIYDEILKKYENEEGIDEVVRSINRNLSSHFANAAAFVRWTHVSPRWIHIDAFQTDFFNKLKDLLYHEKEKGAEKANALITKIIEDFRKHQDDFFKTAVSYVIRTNPQIKIWTASTEQMAEKVEHVRGDVKLKELYYQLPKKLGFKLIPLQQLYKILGTRPGPEMDKAQKLFSGALKKLGGQDRENITNSSTISSITAALKNNLLTYRKNAKVAGHPVAPDGVNNVIQNTTDNETFRGAFHQFIPEIVAELNKPKVALAKLFASKHEFIQDFIDKAKGQNTGENIFWANRTMIFENTSWSNRMIAEQVRQMAGL